MTDNPTILITGATDGLGRALAGHLAAEGARVILHGRDQAKVDQTATDLATSNGLADPPAIVRADFADLQQVRGLSTQIAGITDHLDVLVNNAGIGAGNDDHRALSADGHELRFAVNYLAGFDLTLRLLPLLRAAGGSARIVTVASLGQQPIDFDDVMLIHGYSGTRARTWTCATSRLSATAWGSTRPSGCWPGLAASEWYGRCSSRASPLRRRRRRTGDPGGNCRRLAPRPSRLVPRQR